MGRPHGSSEGNKRMPAQAAQPSLASSRMTSGATRQPSRLSERLQEQSAGTGLCLHRRLTLCPRPEKTCSLLKGQMDPLHDPEMSLALERHTHMTCASSPFKNTHFGVCLSLPWRSSSYFRTTFFFQASQNKCFGNKPVLSAQIS